MSTQIRCHATDCRTFFEKKLGECPECGTECYRPNKWLRTAGLNGALYRQADDSVTHKHAKIGAQQAAREYVESIS